MQVIAFADPTAFLSRVQPFLMAREVQNSLMLGITLRMCARPEWIQAAPYMAAVEGPSHSLALVGFKSHAHYLMLATTEQAPAEAVSVMAQEIYAHGWHISGVIAENALADQFVRAWTAISGAAAHLQMRERLYELHKVIPPANPAPGSLRQATEGDLKTLVPWRAAFMQESLAETPPDDLREILMQQIQAHMLYLWDDHGPVSTAASTRETPHGMSINAVYTPPAYRGRGYASACVAALSQHILDRGKSYCALFTDLNYPTSNAIYQKIGYQPAGDFLEYLFA